MRRGSPRGVAIVSLVAAALALAGCAAGATGAPASPPTIRIGAVFPISGSAASLAGQELRGVQIAADLLNATGGVAGRRIELDVRELESADQAPAVMASLRSDGVSIVMGTYSSDLSVPASTAADAAGMLYWETGAVADRLTGQGLPLVFRVGASGTNLGTNSASFAAQELAPRLGRAPSQLRLAIVSARDDYASSVAGAAASTASAAGVPIVARITYDLVLPGWPAVMRQLAAARPDVIILASHIPDGVAFRQAMIASGMHVGALIGSTMAECDPDFAGELGADAVGVFASDRPTGGFQPTALGPAARATYDRFAAAWASGEDAPVAPSPGSATSPGSGVGGSGGYGTSSGGYATDSGAYGSGSYSGGSGSSGSASDGYGTGDGYMISGPDTASAGPGPTEEGISGFSAAWALFSVVLPGVAGGVLTADAVAAAARAVDLPEGALPNGAGLKFSSDPATLGQNERAAAVIWQWQAVQSYTFVWPPTYATGTIGFVPLGR
jgi:branched-chain amino acid transport system substrate-binding protein